MDALAFASDSLHPGQLEPSGIHPLPTTHAFAVHLIALHPHFWDATVMREYKTHQPFSMPFRVDGPGFADFGIALISPDGGRLSAISLVEWSPSTLAGKRRAGAIRGNDIRGNR